MQQLKLYNSVLRFSTGYVLKKECKYSCKYTEHAFCKQLCQSNQLTYQKGDESYG